jgi:hypothetical protein
VTRPGWGRAAVFLAFPVAGLAGGFLIGFPVLCGAAGLGVGAVAVQVMEAVFDRPVTPAPGPSTREVGAPARVALPPAPEVLEGEVV